jgi:hypothetical protein
VSSTCASAARAPMNEKQRQSPPPRLCDLLRANSSPFPGI